MLIAQINEIADTRSTLASDKLKDGKDKRARMMLLLLILEDTTQKLKEKKIPSNWRGLLDKEKAFKESTSELLRILNDDNRRAYPNWPLDKRIYILEILQDVENLMLRELWMYMKKRIYVFIATFGIIIVSFLVYFFGFRDVKAGPEFEKQHSSVQQDTSDGYQGEENAISTDKEERWT